MAEPSDKFFTNKIVEMYEELNIELVSNIIKQLKETGDISSYTRAQIRQLIKRGGKAVFEQSLDSMSNLSSKRKDELKRLFKEVVSEDMEQYKKMYEYRDKKFALSESQYKLLNIAIKRCDKELKNFTKTVAFSNQQDFVNAVDNMYFQVVTGGLSFDETFRKTTNDLAEKGTTLIMKNGKQRSLEASVRQNVRTSIRDTARSINKSIGKDLGCDGVQINISPNCRPDHKVINGRVFKIKSKEWQKNKHLLDDYNCQHYETPIILDIEENMYSDDEINEANNRVVKYKGKDVPYYEATQKQRALEREIRNAKKMYATLEKSQADTTEARQKVSLAQKNMRNFIKETGLERDYLRERYAGYN